MKEVGAVEKSRMQARERETVQWQASNEKEP